jgi:hypothetical protein
MTPLKTSIAVALSVLALVATSNAAPNAPARQKAPTFAQAIRPAPKRISHYMREMGLTYLEALPTLREANVDRQFESVTMQTDHLDSVRAHMKLNAALPGDKGFIEALWSASNRANSSGMCIWQQSDGTMSENACTAIWEQASACNSRVQEAIDSGIFNDNWNVDCEGGEDVFDEFYGVGKLVWGK